MGETTDQAGGGAGGRGRHAVDLGVKGARKATSAAVAVWVPVSIIAVVGFLLALPFVGPAPPRSLVLATGAEDGAYHRYGLAYAELLAEHDLTVHVRTTAGSVENLELLAAGEADVAFVQGGTVSDDQRPSLAGIASLYYEPMWIFHRTGLVIERPADLEGLRIQVGAEGSGTRQVVLELLAANGVDPATAELRSLPAGEAADALLAGQLDAMVAIASPRAGFLGKLLDATGREIQLLPMPRAAGYAQRFRHLQPVTLLRGVLDFEIDAPPEDIPLVSPTASLLSREDLHPALVPLFIDAARHLHEEGGLFEKEGEFPSPENLDAPVSLAARQYYASGPSFLYRWLPFRSAATLDRLKIMLLPLLTLLVPLMRFAPPVYRWRIRYRIFRWYKLLLALEYGEQDPATAGERLETVRAMEEDIRHVKVPASYGEELSNLRMHLDLVKGRLEAEQAAHAASAG